MIFFDTETCGLHGPIITIQYAHDNEPVKIHNVWTSPVYETLQIITELVYNDVVAFNISFDWFHLCQMFTTLMLYEDRGISPIECIDQHALFEAKARDLDYCLKPKSACDLMIHACKGQYQSTLMDRKPITIRKVPAVLASELVEYLNRTISLKDIYFTRKTDPTKHWEAKDHLDAEGEVEEDFKDIVLQFAPSSALKSLVADITGQTTVTMKEIGIDSHLQPFELGYAPFALAPFVDDAGIIRRPSPENWMKKWPMVIKYHIEHWNYNPNARKYAENDIHYLRMLYDHFGRPALGDHDSTLACMIGAVRWRGLHVDTDALARRKQSVKEVLEKAPYNFNSPETCRRYLSEVLSPTELAVMTVGGRFTTKAAILEQMAGDKDSPAQSRAQEILDHRHAGKELELYDKLVVADRFHASFNVIGALSGRMSGADGLNAQGINHKKEIRQCFGLKWPGQQLTGGDLEASQIAIAAAVYDDPQLNKELQEKATCPDCKGTGIKKGKPCKDCKGTGLCRKKIYGVFGCYLFPGNTYDSIIHTKGLGGEKDLYDRSKKGVLAMLFGGEEYTLSTRVGISEEGAAAAYSKFVEDHPVWGEKRQLYFDMFCSMKQPGGLGTQVIWAEPADYVESMFGFRRYFTLENNICRSLFELSNSPPKEWFKYAGKIRRSTRDQTPAGALRSALYGAAFQIQAKNMRAAANHVIQSPESTIIKHLQYAVWSLQPAGISEWKVMPINIHDEIMAPAIHSIAPRTKEVVDEVIAHYRPMIPFIGMEWDIDIASWGDK